MRNGILIGLIIFLGVLAAGYSFTWYAQADAMKNAVQQVIARVNEHAEGNGNEGKKPLITYDSLEATGFPAQVNIVITRPRFSGRMDLLLAALAAEGQKTPAPQNNEWLTGAPWQQDIQLEGHVILGINALSDHYTLQVIGNWLTAATAAGRSFATTYQPQGATFCSLQLERSAGLLDSLWNFRSLSRDGAAFLRDFRLFDCALPAGSVTDTANNARLGGSGPARFYISNAPVADTQHLRLYLSAADMEVTPEGDAITAAFMTALGPGRPVLRRLALYGRQKVDVDFTYNGPASLQSMAGAGFEISLGRFDLSNAAYSMHMTFYAGNTLGPDGKAQTKLTFRSESDFTPQYDVLLHDITRALIDEALTSTAPDMAEFQAGMRSYTPDQLYAIIAPAIPGVHALGHWVQAVDLEYAGDPQFTAGEATLHDLELSFTPYGIRGNGLAKRENGGQPTGQLTLTCNACAQMIDDLMAYTARLHTVLIYLAPAQAALLAPNPRLSEGVKDYLRELAGKDKVNWSYDIISQPAGVTINGRPLRTAVTRYYEYIAPALKQQGVQP